MDEGDKKGMKVWARSEVDGGRRRDVEKAAICDKMRTLYRLMREIP